MIRRPAMPFWARHMGKLIAGGIAAICIAVAGIALCGGDKALNQALGWQCVRQGANTGRETKYDVLTDTCYIKLSDGTYVDIKQYRAVNTR